MRFTRRVGSILTLAFAAFVLASCADDHAPLAPDPVAPDALLLGDAEELLTTTIGSTTSTLSGIVNGLVECNVSTTYKASRVIGPEGGTLKVGRHSLHVPPKALPQPTLISATAPAGKYVEVRFEPHGLKFDRPTALTMSYSECGILKPYGLRIAYVSDNLEILEVLLSLPNPFNQTVTGKVDHFSRYMLAD